MNIGEISQLSVTDSIKFFEKLELTDGQQHIVTKVMKNISDRLEFLDGVGLSYISLSRKSNTLSG
jgi:excinuclease ABC subunit A